jgi:hypothetical protein
MTGKAYHLATLGALQRHSARLNTSHWLALVPNGEPVPAIGEPDSSAMTLPETAQILALIEAVASSRLLARTMRIPEYTEADLEPLERMHAQQGFDYAFLVCAIRSLSQKWCWNITRAK